MHLISDSIQHCYVSVCVIGDSHAFELTAYSMVTFVCVVDDRNAWVVDSIQHFHVCAWLVIVMHLSSASLVMTVRDGGAGKVMHSAVDVIVSHAINRVSLQQ